MFILFIIILLIFVIAVFIAIFKVIKWTSKDKIRIKWAVSIISFLVLAFVVKRVFFTKMEFIQSNVYSNLYIVENVEKDDSKVEKAILDKIKKHLLTQHKQEIKLSYSNETECIYFYELGGRTFGFLGEAGTGYFIDNEEDLGGFVSEELGMYQEYNLAEFYYKLPENKENSICGQLDLFDQGTFIRMDTICNLNILK